MKSFTWTLTLALTSLGLMTTWAVPMPTGGICAHRGDRAEFPENTVPAFLSAVKKGAAMVEFDVHRCKTGELIVMHDNTIDRTTTGKGRWRDLTFEYLRSVDAGVKKGARFKGVKIPTFDEAIDCFPKDGVWLNVHCDDRVTDEVARKIKAKGRLHQAFIAAMKPGVDRARAAVPEIKVCLFALPKDSWNHAWTAEERKASIAAARETKAEFTQPHNADFTQDELSAYHADGGKVNFFWCNKPVRLAALLARGIDFPLTDNLAPMVKAYNDLLGRSWAPPDPESGFNYTCDRQTSTPRRGVIAPNWFHARERRAFGGIPSIAVSPKNGRLWRTWYGGPTDGEDSNNYAILATSADGGKNWKEVLVADPDGDGPKRAFDPEIWIAPDGRLNWFWAERAVPLRDGAINRFATGNSLAGERLMCLTLDAESEPDARQLPTPRQIASGVMMCKPIVAKDGRWLYPVARWFDDFSARLCVSTDGGMTLKPLGGASLPREIREFDEHNVVELRDGSLRVYMRTRKPHESAWQADSHDGGRTWDAARPCPFKHTGSRFFVRRLQSGSLLLVKHGPLNEDVGRTDMMAYVSDDDGATWKGGFLLKKGGCSYPDGDQAPDGTIHVIMDNDRCGAQQLIHVKFTENDVRSLRAANSNRTIPVVDISQETNRHAFVARGTPKIYQGHPTTALLADGRTMFCVWPVGHGGYGGNLAMSEDGGCTWRDVSARLPAITHRFINCPCLHRLITPAGTERLIFWQSFIAPDERSAQRKFAFGTDIAKNASTAMPAVCSDDGGKTWRALQPLGERFRNILPFQGIVRRTDGAYLGVYHRGPQGCLDSGHLEVCQAVSRDGGLTWSDEKVIAEDPRWNLCEPWVFRAPNGRELCCLLRENKRTGTSKVVFSKDEGMTWTPPTDLPSWLTGDRHQGITLPDGRLVIAYRCQDRTSSLKGHFIAWVGTYGELVSGKPNGCYHIKLLHSYAGGDCGYPGIHLLPDGTIVATTYVKYAPGKNLQSVVSVRFRVDEKGETSE